MPDHAKAFTYSVEGLSYTVTLYEQNGQIFADISVSDGAMDVNAIYFGDDDFSGSSASLGGPLNMNGARLDGETIQWDEAVKLSDPGLGPEGADKETYLEAGDTLTLTLDVDSLDEIDVFGIRATSTTTDAGSIKAVSDDPEEPEEPEEDPVYEKVFFGEEFSDAGDPLGGIYILGEEPDPNPYGNLALPEGTEPTFENYLSYFTSEEVGGDVSALQSVVFYQTAEDGSLVEEFRLDAPEGGFETADDLLAAYDAAIEDGMSSLASDATDGSDLMAALSLEPGTDSPAEDDPMPEEEDIDLL
ncbi:hypothetical protein PXK01_08810 [Phaeobacter sp. PT47_59]|uniref:hypothetical protein n=1 Tax=Phaeobacter sp. PT47_59 TaxID=3029979 RepID=UPI00237FF041|nr:hypothetical protein [Phaeobacter sp. PT47_59]MDE4174255.1 hypothetical protein [Phaeobacter sp. PT47_59]